MRASLLLPSLLLGCAAPVATPQAIAPGLPVAVVLNGKSLPERAASAPFRFLIGGHLYGDMSSTSVPAGTFVAALPVLQNCDADLLLACGDTYHGSSPEWHATTDAFLARLPMPVFNATGNHDVVEREARTHGAFVHGGCLFVLLDTEIVPWEIAGPQLEFLRAALAAASARTDIRAVFCCAHKLVFAHRRRYFEVLLGGNALDGLTRPNRFVADVLPLLASVARAKPVYWCAGDIGTARSLPCFFDRDPTSGVHFLATGLGDLPRDLLVLAEVTAGRVDLRLLALGSERPGALGAYGLDAWRRHFFPAGLPEGVAALRDLLPE